MIWVVIIALIATNALYVAGEFATIGVRRARIRKLAQEGNRAAASLLPIVDDPRRLDRYVATCQIGITVSSLVLGAYGEYALSPSWSRALETYLALDPALGATLAAALVLTVLTCTQIVMGELVPKSIALQFPTQLALVLQWPMALSAAVFRPFIWLLNGSSDVLLRIMRVPVSVHRHIHSLEEIEMMLAESHKGGLLDEEEHERLHHGLELGAKTARQIMTPRPRLFAVSIESTIAECFLQMLDESHTRALVFDGSIDRIAGAVNLKAIVDAYLRGQRNTPIAQMVAPVPVVPETLSIDKLVQLLRENRSHLAVVKDEYGGTAGLVTIHDILTEVLGEVADEFHKQLLPEILSDARVRLPADMRLSRATRFLGKLPEHDADTINGLVIEMLERIPEPGEVLDLPEVRLVIESASHSAVNTVIVEKRGTQ